MEAYLHKIGYSPQTYIKIAKQTAEKAGYEPDTIFFSSDGIHKLEIITPDGSTRRFGRVGYGDYIIYRFLEAHGEVAKGLAERKRRVFRKSHRAIKGDWSKDRFSPNALAINILW